MSEVQLAQIIFGILLLIGGMVLLFLSFKLFYKYLIQEKRCTNKTKGIIKKYTFATHGGENSGVRLPIVFYNVNGKEYKVVGPEYRDYKITTKTTVTNNNNFDYKEDNQSLIINQNINSFVGIYKNPIEKLYPINSEIDVYYNPKNPQLAYVLRYCNKKWQFWLTFSGGIIVLIIDFLILLFL